MNKQNIVSKSETKEPYFVASLARGLAVLQCFRPSRTTLTVLDIADELGIPKGSAYRTLQTLETMGFVQFDPKTKRYQLGIRVLELGHTFLWGLRYPQAASPYLEELARETRLSASMAVRDDLALVYVARASVQRAIDMHLSVGSRLPLHCTSMGKVLLAALAPEAREQLYQRMTLAPHTERTITTLNELRAQVEFVERNGYAISDGELAPELRSLAAPIREETGQIVAAINVSMVSAQVPERTVHREILPKLLGVSRRVSQVLGWDSAAPDG